MKGNINKMRSLLCCMEDEIYVYGIEWEYNAAFVGFLQYACIEQRMYVGMNRFHIPVYPSRCFPYSQWSRSRDGLKKLPPLTAENFKKKRRRFETYKCPLRLAFRST